MKSTASDATLVLHLRPSRRKAREAAVAEVVGALRGLSGHQRSGGPLSEVRDVAWVDVPEQHVFAARSRLSRLGYSGAVDLVRPIEGGNDYDAPTVRWRRQDVALVRVYEEADELLRPHAPDRRRFLLECGDGVVRRVTGYRGGRGTLEHRALPVVDARLLVHLVNPGVPGILLDPFAGTGGIALEARTGGWKTVTADVDPVLRFGLAEIAHEHHVADARELPLADASVDAVATEPPYHPSATEAVAESLDEISRVLRLGGRVAMLIAANQRPALLQSGEDAGLTTELATPVNRKGTDVYCVVWVK